MASRALSCSISNFILAADLSLGTLVIPTRQMGKLKLRKVKLPAPDSCKWADTELRFELRSSGSSVPAFYGAACLLSPRGRRSLLLMQKIECVVVEKVLSPFRNSVPSHVSDTISMTNVCLLYATSTPVFALPHLGGSPVG